MRVFIGLFVATIIGCGAPAQDPVTVTEDDAAPFTPAADDAGARTETFIDNDTGASSIDASDSTPPPMDDAGAPTTKPLGKYVLTWYSFQDNTPVNSALSGSGRKLVPYISVAVPFRLLKAFGGKLSAAS